MANIGTTDDAAHALSMNRMRHTRWFLIAFYAIATVWGARNTKYYDPSALDLLVPVALAISLGWWALVDAREHGHPMPALTRWWFFLLAGLVVPGYVIWTRKMVGVGWVVLHAALWYTLATVAMHISGIIMYGGEWLHAFGF